jgi:hypothetical protein
MSRQLRVRVTYIFLIHRCSRRVRRRRWSAAELRSAWTGEDAPSPHGHVYQGFVLAMPKAVRKDTPL